MCYNRGEFQRKPWCLAISAGPFRFKAYKCNTRSYHRHLFSHFPFLFLPGPPSLSKGGETPRQTAESPEGEGFKLQRFSSSLFPTQVFINMGVEAPAGDNMLKTYCFQCLTLSIHGLLQIITPGEDHMFSRAVFSTYFSEGNDYTGVVPLRLSQSMPLSH